MDGMHATIRPTFISTMLDFCVRCCHFVLDGCKGRGGKGSAHVMI